MASNPLFGILWLILLSFLAWPVAALCAGIWVVLMVGLSVGRDLLYSSIIISVLILISYNYLLPSSIPINSHLRHAVVVPQILTKLWRILLRGQRSVATQSKTAALRALLQTNDHIILYHMRISV